MSDRLIGFQYPLFMARGDEGPYPWMIAFAWLCSFISERHRVFDVIDSLVMAGKSSIVCMLETKLSKNIEVGVECGLSPHCGVLARPPSGTPPGHLSNVLLTENLARG